MSNDEPTSGKQDSASELKDNIPSNVKWRAAPGIDGSISFFNSEAELVASYQQGKVDVLLPSGLRVHIAADSRLKGYQAEYNPHVGALVFTADTLDEIKDPSQREANDKAKKTGWSNLEQKTRYFMRHEYNHALWDLLDNETRRKVIDIFAKPENIGATRLFGSILISKEGYKEQEEKDPSVDCLEFRFGGEMHRYGKELIINELLAHAALGEMLGRDEMTKIQRSFDGAENFGSRSKTAFDAIEAVSRREPEDNQFLVASGLVKNGNFAGDYPTILNVARELTLTKSA